MSVSKPTRENIKPTNPDRLVGFLSPVSGRSEISGYIYLSAISTEKQHLDKLRKPVVLNLN